MRKLGSHNGVEAPLWLLQSNAPKEIMKKYCDEDWAKLNLKSHESVSSRFYLPLRNVSKFMKDIQVIGKQKNCTLWKSVGPSY
jgi:hypothetical protein